MSKRNIRTNLSQFLSASLRSLLLLLLIFQFILGCATVNEDPLFAEDEFSPQEVAALSPEAAYERAFKRARHWQHKAASVDGEWWGIDRLLRDSKAAAARGDYLLANKLVEQAAFLGEQGYRQMKSQKSVKNPTYLYN